MRGLVERTPTCALHVHVGMPDAETAIAVFNRLRGYLPLLQALAAHSPFWYGRDSGFATARAQLFRGFPRAVIPRPFANWDDYATTAAAWVEAGALPDYTYLWWDIRPHPRLGTVEVRRWTPSRGWGPWPASPRSCTPSPPPARTAMAASSRPRR